jgi:Methyltransferase domain
MRKLKWIFIWAGLNLLKRGLKFRISGEEEQWLQPVPIGELINRETFITGYCKNKTVFHIGFADAPYTKEKLKTGTLLHSLLQSVTIELFGIDPDQQAVAIYQQQTKDINVAAVTLDEVSEQKIRQYNLVLIGEVLEHLRNPCAIIEQLEQKLKTGQEILVTVPNYISFDSMAASLHGKESVHADHEWYFSPYTLLKKFSKQKWQLSYFAYGKYGNNQINPVQKQFPATGDCIITVFKKM